MSRLDDALLKHLADGTGRCYPHEGKAMAQELVERRKAEVITLTKTQPIPFTPTGWGTIPP